MPDSSPPPPHGTTTTSRSAHLLVQLEADRALAGDHVLVVEGGMNVAPVARRALARRHGRSSYVSPLEHDLAP